MTEQTQVDLRSRRRDLDKAMQVDRHRLGSQLRSLEQAAASGKLEGEAGAERLRKWDENFARSAARREQRKANVPVCTYDEGLPIAARRQEILEAILREQVVVLCGETGSGKSTQLPKICLEAGRGVSGFIGHTQPRRIAARSIAARLAEELKSTGKEVGFKIRFADGTNENTYIKLMTDGILLAESQTDRFLDAYDTLILDEAHERSLNIDFLLGYLKQLLPRRPDLKVIITSATIDAERFAEHFRSSRGPAPVIQVSGRTYPVDVLYRPMPEEAASDRDWPEAVVDAIEELAGYGPGDMLVFLPTERDIHEMTRVLKGKILPGESVKGQTRVLPLYARLPTHEQNEIFNPSSKRRIVLATNVAESSLTVPNIRYVIDLGTQRLSRYAPKSKIQRLPIEPVSQASADQRKGRCGRVGPGICIRLYSEEDYLSRDRFTSPEIQRTNLASVILQCKALRFGEIEDFPFLDPPRPEAVRDGYKTLFELLAIDGERRITELGRKLSRMPVDPRIGRIILAGADEHCLAEILVIAAALETQDPRDRPLEHQQAADAAHAPFVHPESDFLSYLKLWEFYQHLKQTISRNQLQKAARQNFLSHNRLREWSDVHLQLLEWAQEAGLKITSRREDYAAIHRALLAGFLGSTANLSPEGVEYLVAGGGKAFLWPGSGCMAKKPKWAIASEVVETTRCYLRTAARIDPAWIEPLAEHLVSKTYHDPFWNEKTGKAMCFEKVALMGLVVVPRRPVPLAPVNAAEARKIFIQSGLVEGLLAPGRFAFWEKNRQLEESLRELQVRTRRVGWMLGEQDKHQFYDERLPPDAVDAPALEKWLRTASPEAHKRLEMTEADLVANPDETISAAEFPDKIAHERMTLPLTYRLEPGAADDGVTMTLPREGLNQIDPRRLGWLIPGMLEEKLTALLKSLPKDMRRHFVPIPDTARDLQKQLKFGEGCLLTQVAAELSRRAEIPIRPSDFQSERLPGHLQMNVRVVDAAGEVLAEGKSWEELRQTLGAEAANSFSKLGAAEWSRDGAKTWDFGDLPEQVRVPYHGMEMNGWPAVVDQGEAVGVRLFDSAERADYEHRLGVQRLVYLAYGDELRRQIQHVPAFDSWKKQGASLPDVKELKNHLAIRLGARAAWGDGAPPRTAEGFRELSKPLKKRLTLAVQEVAGTMAAFFPAYVAAKHAIQAAVAPQWKPVVDDLREQMAELVEPGFLLRAPWQWLQHYPRYFRGMVQRLERLPGAGLARDLKELPKVQAWQDQIRLRREKHRQGGIFDPQLDLFRWLFEEWRVSLFAQSLGTSQPVSEKRLLKQWEQVRDV